MNTVVQPLHPDITLSTGKVIRHTYAANGSQNADPAMTKPEIAEYDSLRIKSWRLFAPACGNCGEPIPYHHPSCPDAVTKTSTYSDFTACGMEYLNTRS